MPIRNDADPMDSNPYILAALTSLNHIGAAINRLGLGESVSLSRHPDTSCEMAVASRAWPTGQSRGTRSTTRLGQGRASQIEEPETGSGAVGGGEATVRLIVEGAIEVVPDASAVLYIYDQSRRGFDLASRVSASEPDDTSANDEPRPNGIGVRAVNQLRRILSYEEIDLDIHPVWVRGGARAVACFPLVVAEQAMGALYVYLCQDRQFSQFELLMLENFVNYAAIAVYQSRGLADVRRNLERREDELQRLRHAGLVISSRLGLKETLDVILQMAMEVTGAHYGIFRLLDKSGQHLITHAVADEHLDRPQVEALPVGETSVMGWVATHREPVHIRDLRAEPWCHIYYPLDADLEMRSELAVPLVGASGRLEGVLNLESPLVDAFDEQDSHLLQALATQAVIAIQEVRLLDAIQEVTQLLLAQPGRQVLTHLVELACELLNAAASAIWTLEGDELVLQVASTGSLDRLAPSFRRDRAHLRGSGQGIETVRRPFESTGYQRGERLPLYGSLTGQAVLSGGPVTADNVRDDPRFHRSDLARAQGWDQALIVPLLSSGNPEPVGAFSVYSTISDPRRFVESVWDEKVLTCLAHYAALAVHTAARQEALRAAQEQHAVAETFAAVGDIAANVLHHLNNKVGTIPVRVQGIEDKCKSALLADVYLAANLSEIERSATEAMETVRANLSQLRPIRLAPTDVAVCVGAAVRDANLPSGVQVDLKDLGTLPAVMAGGQSLSLVFTNLFVNAADAMQGNGIITTYGIAYDDWVEVVVSDDGPGIALDLQDRIFEFSFSGRRATRTGKLGFGLWWVKTLMVRLGGSVSVESDGRHGTTFRLSLPRADHVARTEPDGGYRRTGERHEHP